MMKSKIHPYTSSGVCSILFLLHRACKCYSQCLLCLCNSRASGDCILGPDPCTEINCSSVMRLHHSCCLQMASDSATSQTVALLSEDRASCSSWPRPDIVAPTMGKLNSPGWCIDICSPLSLLRTRVDTVVLYLLSHT